MMQWKCGRKLKYKKRESDGKLKFLYFIFACVICTCTTNTKRGTLDELGGDDPNKVLHKK
jgi:hypothetical protein